MGFSNKFLSTISTPLGAVGFGTGVSIASGGLVGGIWGGASSRETAGRGALQGMGIGLGMATPLGMVGAGVGGVYGALGKKHNPMDTAAVGGAVGTGIAFAGLVAMQGKYSGRLFGKTARNAVNAFSGLGNRWSGLF